MHFFIIYMKRDDCCDENGIYMYIRVINEWMRERERES